MDTKTISIEVTPEQLEKLKKLEDRGFTVGEVIDKFSELEERIISHGNSFIDESINSTSQRKLDLEKELEKTNNELDFLIKFKNSNYDVADKGKILKKEHSNLGETYDDKLYKVRRNISWINDFFKR